MSADVITIYWYCLTFSTISLGYKDIYYAVTKLNCWATVNQV